MFLNSNSHAKIAGGEKKKTAWIGLVSYHTNDQSDCCFTLSLQLCISVYSAVNAWTLNNSSVESVWKTNGLNRSWERNRKPCSISHLIPPRRCNWTSEMTKSFQATRTHAHTLLQPTHTNKFGKLVPFLVSHQIPGSATFRVESCMMGSRQTNRL